MTNKTIPLDELKISVSPLGIQWESHSTFSIIHNDISDKDEWYF